MQMKVIKLFLLGVVVAEGREWSVSDQVSRAAGTTQWTAVSRSDLMDCLQCCCIAESSLLITLGLF